MTAWWPSGSPPCCPVLKSALWHVEGLAGCGSIRGDFARSVPELRHRGRGVHWGGPSPGLCFVLLNCLEMAGLFPDAAESDGKNGAGGEKSVLFLCIKGASGKGKCV